MARFGFPMLHCSPPCRVRMAEMGRAVRLRAAEKGGRRAMLKNSCVSTWILASLGVCAWLANPPAARPAQADAGKVTAVRLRLVPESYAGTCPGKVQLVGRHHHRWTGNGVVPLSGGGGEPIAS